MKTDEQVLKEWMDDRIEFDMGLRRYFTQYEFAAVVDTLCYKRLVDLESYNVKPGLFKRAVKASNHTLRMDLRGNTFPKLEYISTALRAEENKSLRDPRQIARFESVSELYDYLQEKDIKNGVVRVQIPMPRMTKEKLEKAAKAIVDKIPKVPKP